MGFRFLHLADIHLETHFGGRPDTRERLRRAAFEAFAAAVDYALEHELHAVLAAGDLYDDPILSLRTELELGRQVRRLGEAGIWFLHACGNHDPGGAPFRAAGFAFGAEPRVHVFRGPQPRRVTVTDPCGTPVGIVVGAGHASVDEGGNLAAGFERIASPLPVVGLLHTFVEGAEASGQHDRYAPSGHADFRRLDYSYWALGHIHVRQRAVPDAPAFYAGNLQGRNPRECGEKGGLVVEALPGVPAEPRFVRFAPVRWLRLRVDALPAEASPEALVDDLARRLERERSSPAEELAVVFELAGATPLAGALRGGEARQALAEEILRRTGALEVELRAEAVYAPCDRRALRESRTVLGRALELIERAGGDPELLEALAPAPLAGGRDLDPAARRAYLGGLLEGLAEEAVERSLAGTRG